MYKHPRNAFLTIILLLLTGTAFSFSNQQCSNNTLEGSFGFTLSGKNIALNGDYVLVGRLEADGKGGYKGTGSQSANGRVAHAEFTGTYTVNADCTGTAEILFANSGVKAQIDFVLVADGNEIYLMDSGGKTVEYGAAKRLFFRKKSSK